MNSNTPKAHVVGAGFAGLSAACYLAKEGYEVTILEKNDQIGGRCRSFKKDGFLFDMGPSWYWMPDVFERFFNDFGYKVSDFYNLVRVDPSYSVFWKENEKTVLPASFEEICDLFESYEKGAGKKLEKVMQNAAVKYEVGMKDLVHKPGHSALEYVNGKVLKGLFQLHLLQSVSKYFRKYFKDPRILEILEFPVLFLGAKPQKIPALYTLMNYADLKMGTWYPMGGMIKIIEGMEKVARSLGVEIKTGEPVKSIEIHNKKITKLITPKAEYETKVVVNAADYHFFEQNLLPKAFRMYDEKYWKSRTMAPSSLLYYVGVNKKIKDLTHHNLFFDSDFSIHAGEIYEDPQWPSDPLFYVCCPSKTDPEVAPEGKENMFILIPVAPGLDGDNEAIREKYFEQVIQRMEEKLGVPFKDDICFVNYYGISNFAADYNAFKGNAYGLANTLQQTGFLKPKMKNKKLTNLFNTGQLTAPGPGVPPAIISGKIIAGEIMKN